MPSQSEKSAKRQFVVLHHEMPATSKRASHWDLMLEQDGVLTTWALDREPTPAETVTGIGCLALPDHRQDYLQYEGPISNDRGHVTRWDRGDYLVQSQSEDELVVQLFGERLLGVFRLTRGEAATDTPATDETKVWSFRANKTSY